MKFKKRLRTAGVIVLLTVILLGVLYFVFDKEKKVLDDQVRSTLSGEFVKIPAGNVHYEIAGPQNAPVVVFIHGFSVPYYIWDNTFDNLAQSGFQVLRYDLFGRGYSDRPEAEYNLNFYVDQLKQLIKTLKIEKPIHIVGLSYGGPIAAAYVNQNPDIVRTLTLIDPQIAPVSTMDIFPMNIPLVGEYVTGVYIVPFMLPHTQSEDFYRPDRFPDWEEQYHLQMQYKGFKRAILSSIRNTVNIDAASEYSAVGQRNIPILLIWGRDDQVISATEIDIVRELIPRVEFYTIDNAGHLPHYEQPDIVNPILADFLANSSLRK
jgi:pimeloyl-ACP methyl ester carboxylesterase